MYSTNQATLVRALPLLLALVSLRGPAASAEVPPNPRVKGHREFAAGCARESSCPWRDGEGLPAFLVDTDPGLGQFLTDVDDAVSLHYLVHAGVEVEGLTTVFGNAPLPRTHSVALLIAGGWRIPVHQGAGEAGKGGWDAVKQLNNHEGGVLALGPVTNLAFALQRNPSWKQLVVLGGSLNAGPNIRYLRTKELNFAADEWAAAQVLAKAPVAVQGDPDRRPILVPMESCRESGIFFAEDEIDLLPSWLGDQCKGWLQAVRWMTWSEGYIPWDLVASMVLTHPELFTFRRGDVRLMPNRAWYQRGYVEYDWEGGDGWDVVQAIDGPGLKQAYHRLYNAKGQGKTEGGLGKDEL